MKNLETLRHSTSHVMAQAVKRLYPGVRLGIGPAIEDGFYYDFDLKENLLPEDLPKIEKEMQKIIAEDLKFEKREVSKEEARKIFKKQKEDYKLELLEDIPENKVTLYRDGEFVDLCRGPHLSSTGALKIFKLLSIAGAYWRGSERRPMLQRIYGAAFTAQKDLERYLERREAAKLRDHRKLGKELDYFTLLDEVGPGLVVYHPKGAYLRSLICDFETAEHLKRGYELVASPHILKSDIWIRSGHYDYYKENMFIFKAGGQEYAVKPMNCPAHMLVYKSRTRSYREFPIRYFEIASVYRNEKSGVLHGLLRVRGFTQDDAHIFCLPEQLTDEIKGSIQFSREILAAFGFKDFQIEVSTRPGQSIGEDKDWERATEALLHSLKESSLSYEVHEGEGAFYGPKIDIKLKDALGRLWQCTTIQCDFALPERFELTYSGRDGHLHRPIMLHRAILGSLERFIGVLLEHYGGALPLWLSPIQVRIFCIDTKSGPERDYAKAVKKTLQEGGLRVELDESGKTLNAFIRSSQVEKIPYILVVGKKEMADNTVSVRRRSEGDQESMKTEKFLAAAQAEVNSHA